MTEFYTQGDEERGAGVPISMFCDRNAPTLTKCQKGFVAFIVRPIFQALTDYVVEGLESTMQNLDANVQFWNDVEAKFPEEHATFKTPSDIPVEAGGGGSAGGGEA